ncbi:MAG TPA: vitamin B12-dependent ribonucleotide reductase [candidate division WOR-3 bacterium]|uniref:Vitamin B12-dependent ribonucleotide reductase n=1 Tax=candidate division WOR-3 bacterium TaxID=2052148 RepID=A0A7C0X825_UNCW3|nr:vitamin B12-dependent ribonucleotide reductase [candidate division WOR-3 bacterium]
MVLSELSLSENALTILRNRYLKKNDRGEVIETPEEMFLRVAKAIAEVERLYDNSADVEAVTEKFYNMMVEFRFLPNSPTLMNAGTPLGQLSACFVLPVGDSMEEIFEAVKKTAIIHKTGGGTGFSFSRLRPRNDIVSSTGGVASGPISFMKVFNEATEAVKQGGRRRGANMGILRVDHPDILGFIAAKHQEGELANFNISVAITDRFMEAVKKDEEYELINPRSGKVVGKLRAREVWKKLVEGAWRNGEPGVIFIDIINRFNPVPGAGEIESTNPCGEQPLLPYESCNLGSVNLAKFVHGDMFFLEKGRKATLKEALERIDWDGLRKTVEDAVHFLDNVIDANHFPFPEIEEMTMANRKIGLGVMGFADMLIQLGVPYRSREALDIGSEVMKFIQETARGKSRELGEERGSFPNIEKSIFEPPMRNATVTTIAPTGTISMIADTSSGIEPIFSLVYVKRVLGGKELLYANRYLEEALREMGVYSEALMEKLAGRRTIKDVEELPELVREIFDTTFDISPEQHVRMQAAFQRYVDNAVSKTINMPNEATPEDVEKAYMLAYELNLKGITVYRDGSRKEQVIMVAKENEKRKRAGTISPRSRPLVTKGRTIKMQTEMGSLYVTVNEDEYGLFEVFVHLGKSGSSSMAFTEAIGRLISLALRSGISPKEVIKQLKSIKSSTPVRQEDGEIVFSVPDAIAKALEKYLKGGEQLELLPKKNGKSAVVSPVLLMAGDGKKSEEDSYRDAEICPECGGVMVYTEGCMICRDCGYSKCE